MNSPLHSRVIHLNQDDAAFYRGKPVSEMSVEGLKRLVDFYAQGSQLGGLAFCVNMQRALFPSRVWENLPDDVSGGEWCGLAELGRKGIDQFEVWLRRAREKGIEAFLTMRMNDCHGLEGQGDWWHHRKKGEDQEHYRQHATEFWKRNPQFRRAPYRYERSFEAAFDYAHLEVREHHLKLIRELFERYDMDGLELDWMRWLFCFSPGGEAAGRAILADFVRRVNELRLQAQERWGHRIALRHRVPAEPEACEALGFDVLTWKEAGAVDELILGLWWVREFRLSDSALASAGWEGNANPRFGGGDGLGLSGIGRERLPLPVGRGQRGAAAGCGRYLPLQRMLSRDGLRGGAAVVDRDAFQPRLTHDVGAPRAPLCSDLLAGERTGSPAGDGSAHSTRECRGRRKHRAAGRNDHAAYADWTKGGKLALRPAARIHSRDAGGSARRDAGMDQHVAGNAGGGDRLRGPHRRGVSGKPRSKGSGGGCRPARI